MKKVLKYEVVSEDTDEIIIKITEQSHRSEEFGNSEYTFCIPNCNCSILSDSDPEFTSGLLYVKGHFKPNDDKLIKIPRKHFDEVNRTIKAYNEYEFQSINIPYPLNGKTMIVDGYAYTIVKKECT